MPPPQPKAAEQDRGNSGVYLQSRYEVQILDSFGHYISDPNDCGAIYGVKDPAVNEAFPPGIWQSYDIVFRAAGLERDDEAEQRADHGGLERLGGAAGHRGAGEHDAR